MQYVLEYTKVIYYCPGECGSHIYLVSVRRILSIHISFVESAVRCRPSSSNVCVLDFDAIGRHTNLWNVQPQRPKVNVWIPSGWTGVGLLAVDFCWLCWVVAVAAVGRNLFPAVIWNIKWIENIIPSRSSLSLCQKQLLLLLRRMFVKG